MRTIAVANAKGGTGKTTVSVHLATGLAREGKKVLLVDLDPQGNASLWLLGHLPPQTEGIAEALSAGRITDAQLHQVEDVPGLKVAPATPKLASSDLALASEIGGETILGKLLQGRAKEFDVAVLDCPPNIGMTVISALCAADGVISPVLPSFLTLSGLRTMTDTITRLRERLNARTDVLGYVLFAADGREAITAEARELVREQMGDKLYKAEIRVSAAAKTLPAHRSTAWDKASDPRGHEDYSAFLRETMARLERPSKTGRATKGQTTKAAARAARA
jgi:chromosome partitioning protein